jgi:predicted metal-dependent phosphoesterase TrpH
MHRGFVVSSFALIFGMAAGTSLAWPDSPAPVGQSPTDALAADLHVHAFLSDGVLSPFGLWWLAKRRGLDVIAITNHNGVTGGKIGARISKVLGPPLIIPGQEVTLAQLHILAIGISSTISTKLSPRAVMAEIHRQGGVAILAHPRDRAIQLLIAESAAPDGIERRNRDDDPDASALDRIREQAHEGPIFRAANSDYHWLSSLGYQRNLIFADSASTRAVIMALRQRRVVAVDSSGLWYGDRSFVARAPSTKMRSPSSCAVATSRDALTRLCAWLGVFGVFAFRARRA